MIIPMSAPDITDAETSMVTQVLKTPFLSIGPMLNRFEEGIAQYVGAAHAVAVNSGTSGLHLCVRALGIGEGDVVVTTPFSFVASTNCILYERAKPVFVDIDAETLNIDIAKLRATLEALRDRGIRPKAVLPVHVFGQPCDMAPIIEMARAYGFAVIEDACEAIGAEYLGHRVGTLGSAGVFAFYPNKQMTTGEGGVIVTNDNQIAEMCRSMRNQGRDKTGAWLKHDCLGYNYRMDEMSAALGIAQLGRIEELLTKRAQVAKWYSDRLGSMPALRVPWISPSTTRMSWFVYVIRLAPGLDKDGVMATLEGQGIPTRPYFSPIHLQPFMRQMLGCTEGDFPVTEEVAKSALALPFSSVMTESEVDYVCERLADAVR